MVIEVLKTVRLWDTPWQPDFCSARLWVISVPHNRYFRMDMGKKTNFPSLCFTGTDLWGRLPGQCKAGLPIRFEKALFPKCLRDHWLIRHLLAGDSRDG